MKVVNSILGRSVSGISIRPFLVETEDGTDYFLKPCSSLADSLIGEWIGSSLARTIGLPVAEFEIVQVPSKLATLAKKPEFSELGQGPAFASKALPASFIDLDYFALFQVDQTELAHLLIFDF